MRLGSKKKYLLFLFPVLIELFVCNANFWTFGLVCPQPESSLLSDLSAMEGLERLDEHTFCIKGTESGQHYLEFADIHKDVWSVFLDLSISDLAYTGCDIYAKDDGNAGYYHIPGGGSKYIVVPSVQESKWFRSYFYGTLHSLKLQFDEKQMETGNTITVSDIRINRPKGMFFSLIRVGGMELLLVLALVFRKGSVCYNLRDSECKGFYRVFLAVIVALQIIFITILIQTASPYTETVLAEGDIHTQYQRLAVAMAKGHVSLELEVPKVLLSMENPYDTDARNALFTQAGIGSLYAMDNAYYKGNFYVYFGVVPVLLFYLPYYLLFHADLPNYVPVLISWIMVCIGSARLIGTIIKKWFSNFPYILYLLMVAIFPFSIGSMVIFQRTGIYEVPISTGVMFAVLGLDLWLESVEGAKIISIPKMVSGSVCIALIAGCRPTIFAIFFLSFLIFGTFIIRDKKICIQKYWKEVTAFLAPFFVIAAGLMYYNAIRFDSVFDFGAAYNLTINDMTNRGHHIARAGLGIFEFFFKPFALSASFPFIQVQGTDTSGYMGRFFYCPDHGGIFFVCPFLLCSLVAVIGRKKLMQYRQPWRMAMTLLLLAVLTASVTVDIGGTYPRYKTDFAFMVGIAGVLAVCMADTYLTDHGAYHMLGGWRWTVFLLCIVSALLSFLTFFSSIVYQLWAYHPHRFYVMKYMFEFWK